VIVDGHNDLVLRTWRGEPVWQMDLSEADEAGYAGGFFAIYVPSPHPPDPTEIPYALPLADPIPTAEAARVAEELYATLRSLPVAVATSADDFTPGRVTAISRAGTSAGCARSGSSGRAGMRSRRVSRSASPARRTPARA